MGVRANQKEARRAKKLLRSLIAEGGQNKCIKRKAIKKSTIVVLIMVDGGNVNDDGDD